jgi:hypothetical protein
LVSPDALAGLDVHREHVVCARNDVEHAVVNDRLCFAGVLRIDAGPVGARATRL